MAFAELPTLYGESAVQLDKDGDDEELQKVIGPRGSSFDVLHKVDTWYSLFIPLASRNPYFSTTPRSHFEPF